MPFRISLRTKGAAIALLLPIVFTSCKSSTTTPTPPPTFTKVYLTANTAGAGALAVDPNLQNPWGVTFDNTNSFLWVGVNHSGTVNSYDTATGAFKGVALPVPSSTGTSGGAPTGLITMPLTHPFTISGSGAALYATASEDGTVSAQSSGIGSPAKVIDNSSSSAVYKGLAVVTGSLTSTLYVANFRGGIVETYDQSFNTSGATPIQTPTAVKPYGPFNVAYIDNKLYVAYARKKAPDAGGGVDDSSGAGIGAIMTFDPSNPGTGTVFANGGTLNSPWAIVKAPSNFGAYSNDILVGNFGDGTINVFDNSGKYLGQLEDTSGPIKIDGLWTLLPSPAANSSRIYFTAGPNDEADGVIGYLQMK